MSLNINLTRRVRRRKLKDGSVVEQARYAEARRRWAAGLRQLPQALLDPDAEAPVPAGGGAAQRAPFLHLGVAGAGRRSWPRHQTRWPQERRCDAQPLYARNAWR